MRCHYEVLNLARDAEASEIKTAYRKLALKWHPDKNLNSPEEAKEEFQLVQQAYEVLSDPQERAWYDNHREQILKGSSNNTNFTDNSLDVFQYFTTTCFKGYNETPDGFYSVYAKVFETIAAEDIEYMDSESEYDQIPKFGDSESDYDTVVGPFYAYWIGYSTKKSYVWLDPYDIRETRDRRVVKLIEKENKKVRQKARKDRNEEVRNLVAFVRKRDKRVQAHQKFITERNLENRKKQEEIRKQKILERTQELDKAKKNEQEWSKFDNMQSELKEIEKHLANEFGDVSTDSASDDDDEIESNLYCIACNKMFKTINAFNNHETSKRHKENVEKIKKQFSDDDEEEEPIETVSGDQEESIETESDTEVITKKKKNKSKKKIISHDSDNESVDFDFGLSKKQKRKNQREQQLLSNLSPDDLSESESENLSNQKADSDDDNFKPIQTKKQKKKRVANKNLENSTVTEELPEEIVKTKKNKKIQSESNLDVSHDCVVCKGTFPSKNKLFDHLKKTGHSTALPHVQPAAGNKKSKKSKRIINNI